MNFSSVLLNFSSSAFFALGASIILITCIVIIVIPIMHRMRKLDEIVMTKLALLPTSHTYGTLLNQLVDHSTAHEAILDQYTKIAELLSKLHNELDVLNNSNFVDEFAKECDIKIHTFVETISDLDQRIADFAIYIQDSDEQSGVQLENLVTARIETTEFIIKFVEQLTISGVVSDISVAPLQEIKQNLQKGLDSVRKSDSYYKVYTSNRKSGRINRFTDIDKY